MNTATALRWKRSANTFLLLGSLTLVHGGCATVGPAVPKLSADIGDRVTEMRSLHEQAIRRMFDGERTRVNAFIDEQWTPTFLRHYIGISGIVGTLSAHRTISAGKEDELALAFKEYLTDSTEASTAARAVVSAIEKDRGTEEATIRQQVERFVEKPQMEAATAHILALLGADDPNQELLEWARQAELQIRAQRTSMLAPIDDAEEEVLTQLGSSYDELIAAQSALTARVQAAAKVKEIQDDALRAMGLQEGFATAKAQVMAVGKGVSRGLADLEKLNSSGLLSGTKAGEVLRRALEESQPAKPNSEQEAP